MRKVWILVLTCVASRSFFKKNTHGSELSSHEVTKITKRHQESVSNNENETWIIEKSELLNTSASIEVSIKNVVSSLRSHAAQDKFDVSAFLLEAKRFREKITDLESAIGQIEEIPKIVKSELVLAQYLIESMSIYVRRLQRYSEKNTEAYNHVYAMAEISVKALALQSAPDVLDDTVSDPSMKVLELWRLMYFCRKRFVRKVPSSLEENRLFEKEYAATKKTIEALGNQLVPRRGR